VDGIEADEEEGAMIGCPDDPAVLAVLVDDSGGVDPEEDDEVPVVPPAAETGF
jgi:hypothetical protein